MPSLIISALISSFTFVRLIKGPWMRYPHFLAAAMIGSALFAAAGGGTAPATLDDYIFSDLLAFAGSAAGIFVLGRVTG